MKVLVDTNVLISAFVFGGTARKAFDALLDSEIGNPLIFSPKMMIDFLGIAD